MVTVSVVAGIMYMDLGLPNDINTLYTGLMYLPWTIKPLWAPLVEMWGTKRRWVLAMQFLMAITLGAVGAALQLPSYLPVKIGRAHV